MTCCIFGVLATAIALWIRAYVRERILGKKPDDPTAWHLPVPRDPEG